MQHGLIVTHHGSGGTLLCRILSTNIRVHCYGSTGLVYDHPTVIERARKRIDSVLGPNAGVMDESCIYIDKLMKNYEFTCKYLYDVCKFVYMVRSPFIPLLNLIGKKGMEPQFAENYYLFRLRRMCEMARKTGGLLLTYEDLMSKRALPLLKNYLGMKSPFTERFTPLSFDEPNLLSGRLLQNPVEPVANIPQDVLNRCSVGYNKYLSFMESRTGLIRFAASTAPPATFG